MSSDEIQPEGRMWLLVILVLLGFGVALIYFTNKNPDIAAYDKAQLSNPLESRQARVYTVYYNGGVFSPTNLRIHNGDTVKFQNDGDQPIHILADDPTSPVGLDSVGDVPTKSSFAYTFTRAGTFGYNNSLNKTERGTVIVRP